MLAFDLCSSKLVRAQVIWYNALPLHARSEKVDIKSSFPAQVVHWSTLSDFVSCLGSMRA